MKHKDLKKRPWSLLKLKLSGNMKSVRQTGFIAGSRRISPFTTKVCTRLQVILVYLKAAQTETSVSAAETSSKLLKPSIP